MLHLLPGALITLFFALTAPVARGLGFPWLLAIFLAIPLVLIPLSSAIETVRTAPEFRRLVDGAKASLSLIPKAIATRDADLLHRVLIELRSFDNLLAFRYG